MSTPAEPAGALPPDATAIYRRYLGATVLNGLISASAAGLGATDFQALNLIALAGTLSPGELARRTGLTTGATTRVIDRLERDGLVRRVPDVADRRRVTLEQAGTPSRLDETLEPARREIGALLATYPPEHVAVLFDWFARAADAYESAIAEVRGDHHDGSPPAG